MSALLKIQDLHVALNDKEGGKDVLRGLSLTINAGERHAVMGPNGSGKSTLAHLLAGHPSCEVRSGTVTWLGEDLLALAPEIRASRGIGLAFQYPIEIPGVTSLNFMRTALNAQRKSCGEKPIGAAEFLKLVRARATELGLDDNFLRREVNVGFSGGEKKRHEILQLALLRPRLCIFDEIDSGLDVDALQQVATMMQTMQDKTTAQLVITHYQRLLAHLTPTHVHVLAGGRIARSGDASLAEDVERTGYGDYEGAEQVKGAAQ